MYLFTFQKLTHNRVQPLGLGTKSIGEAHPFASLVSGLTSSIIPIWIICSCLILTMLFFSQLSR